MKIANWKSDYTLLDASCGERLERWKDIILIRPDPQIIWKTKKDKALWAKADAIYNRSNKGGGSWNIKTKVPISWKIGYKELKFNVKLMGFKHTGIFPEQAVNWDKLQEIIRNSKKQLKVLNLFAYTGAMTLACASAGAKVCHVDSSKGMVLWGKDNAKLSNLSDKPIRWIVDDCFKFVKKEQRRNNKYDIIIMDPPSYGRGPNGEIWQLENNIYDFILDIKEILEENAMVVVNSYTAGVSPAAMEYILSTILKKQKDGKVYFYETCLKVESTGLSLPCGYTAIWENLDN